MFSKIPIYSSYPMVTTDCFFFFYDKTLFTIRTQYPCDGQPTRTSSDYSVVIHNPILDIDLKINILLPMMRLDKPATLYGFCCTFYSSFCFLPLFSLLYVKFGLHHLLTIGSGCIFITSIFQHSKEFTIEIKKYDFILLSDYFVTYSFCIICFYHFWSNIYYLPTISYVCISYYLCRNCSDKIPLFFISLLHSTMHISTCSILSLNLLGYI